MLIITYYIKVYSRLSQLSQGDVKVAQSSQEDYETLSPEVTIRVKITNYNKQITNKSQIQNYKLQKVLPGALV